MLILVGILIVTITGENELISRTKIAKERMEEAKAKESLELKIASIRTEKQGDAKLDDLDNLTIDGYNVTTSSIGRIITMTKDGETYTFLVNENLEITKLDSINIESSNPKIDTEGEWQFTNGSQGFNETVGKVEFSSLGIKPKTYGDGSIENWGYWKKICRIEKELEKSINLDSKFEISTQLFINDNKTNYMGFVIIQLYKKENDTYQPVAYINVNDAWGIDNWYLRNMNINNLNILNERIYTIGNLSGRYAIIGDGEKVYCYFGDQLLASTEYTQGLQVDKIEIVFSRYEDTAYPALPVIIEDLHVGKPLYYKSIIGE